MRQRRLFWDAEGKRRSRNPYQKSTIPWIDEKQTQQFLLDYVLRTERERWQGTVVKLGLVSPEYLDRLGTKRG